tara:strand:- start:290 stop:3055 length:2766 start_codon:yes stop_codon:yes gene_type:complete
MSTQLILYPQTYEGQYSYISSPSTIQYIVNGILFTGFNSTSLHNSTAGAPPQDAIDNQPPTILGNWYRFTTTGGDYGAVTAPTYALGAVQLSHNAVTAGLTGLYQKLSQLIVGAVYDVKISIVTPQTEFLTFEMWDGTVNYNTQSLSAYTATITTTFTAQTPNDTFLIYYEGLAANLSISNISILQSPTTPSLIYTELQDGQVICDLYQEEDIPLTLSIDDFKNVAEKVQSYSKDFNLPATKRNNQIFNNMFEVTRTAQNTLMFNPYVKTKCVLKQDGFILFEGYLRMIDIKDKEGEISYNVNLYSEVIALADVLKDATFSELDFKELEHTYNKTEIKRSWNDAGASITYPNPNTSGFRETYDTLRYPFIDWTHQFLISQNTSATGPTAGNPQLTSLEQAFRPCIQLKYLINKIFAASGFNYTSDFFDSVDFGKLYMDFNWGSALAPNNNMGEGTGENMDINGNTAALSYSRLEFDDETFTIATELGYDNTTSIFTANRDNQVYFVDSHFVFDYYNATGAYGSIGRAGWEKYNSAGVATGFLVGVKYLNNVGAGGSIIYHEAFTITLNTGEGIRPSFRKDYAGVTIDQVSTNAMAYPPYQNFSTVTTGTEDVTTEVLLENLRGELGQWDFLKGIMTMFNLVSMVDENDPNNILIEPYADIFINNTAGTNLADRTIQHDWTEKIDASEMELQPLTDLNKNTIFQFVEDDDDHAFKVYKNALSGHLYGSKVWDASGFTILEGTEEIIAEPFAATVSAPLIPQLSNFVVPLIYTRNDEGICESFDNSPRIFYNNGIKGTTASYYIPEQNGLSSENQANFLQFSHLSDIPTSSSSRDFVFASEQLLSSIGSPPTDNLFSVYWQPYFNELYNADTRTMTLKVNLSPSDVAVFKFYDTVFIKNRVFRVNKIEYKPNDLATVEFILIP